jgi:hypothetical protein
VLPLSLDPKHAPDGQGRSSPTLLSKVEKGVLVLSRDAKILRSKPSPAYAGEGGELARRVRALLCPNLLNIKKHRLEFTLHVNVKAVGRAIECVLSS